MIRRLVVVAVAAMALAGCTAGQVEPKATATTPAASRVVSVRFTCVGGSKATSIKSIGGGTIMRTNGCLAGEIFGATFNRSSKLDPAKITLTVDPDTYWQIQVSAGKHVQHLLAPTGTPATSA